MKNEFEGSYNVQIKLKFEEKKKDIEIHIKSVNFLELLEHWKTMVHFYTWNKKKKIQQL